VILIQQIRQTDLDYLSLIAGRCDGGGGSARILIIATENPPAVNIIDAADYAEWISPQRRRQTGASSGKSIVIGARAQHPVSSNMVVIPALIEFTSLRPR
jgi:hypothetical protein